MNLRQTISTIIGVFLIFTQVLSCRKTDEQFDSLFLKTITEKEGEELLEELLLLDQYYPGELKPKVVIGSMLLAYGEIEKAGIYLQGALPLAERSKDRRLRYIYYCNLARYYLLKKDYEKGRKASDKALILKQTKIEESPPFPATLKNIPTLNKETLTGVVFTKARCLAGMEDEEGAIDAFLEGLRGDSYSEEEDIFIFLSLLIRNRDVIDPSMVEEAIIAVEAFHLKNGYVPGLDNVEISFYLTFGFFREALLSSVRRIEYLIYTGAVSPEEAIILFGDVEDGLHASLGKEEKGLEELLKELKLFLSGELKGVSKIIDWEIRESPEICQNRYLFLLSKIANGLEAGIIPEEHWEDYLSLEPYLFRYPAYYYNLWKFMLEINRLSGKETVGNTLIRASMERCIILSGDSKYSRETRGNLGVLLEMSFEEGEKLILIPEIEEILLKLSMGASVDILDPVVKLLSLPENIYQMAALLILKAEAERNHRIASYLEQKMADAPTRLKERLKTILGA